MCLPKILQTIKTLHILTAFCMTETRIGTLLAPYLHFLQQKDGDSNRAVMKC